MKIFTFIGIIGLGLYSGYCLGKWFKRHYRIDFENLFESEKDWGINN